MTEQVCAQSMAEMLLGQPELALVTVAQLENLDLAFNDGNDVRALAHLALGDTDTAVASIRRFAIRAAVGVLPGESNDAMLLLASLALHQGDDDAARRFLLNAGSARMPSTRGASRHLARQLGIADAHAADIAALYLPDNQHGPMGATRSMNALRAELTRRAWI